MTIELRGKGRPHLTYSGIKLPLKLVEPLEEDQIQNRNTYILGFYDDKNLLIGVRKMVYSAVEFEHLYRYDPTGQLVHVTIINAEGESTEVIPKGKTSGA